MYGLGKYPKGKILNKEYLVVSSFVLLFVIMMACTVSSQEQIPFIRMDRNGDGQMSLKELSLST